MCLRTSLCSLAIISPVHKVHFGAAHMLLEGCELIVCVQSADFETGDWDSCAQFMIGYSRLEQGRSWMDI